MTIIASEISRVVSRVRVWVCVGVFISARALYSPKTHVGEYVGAFARILRQLLGLEVLHGCGWRCATTVDSMIVSLGGLECRKTNAKSEITNRYRNCREMYGMEN